MAHEEIIRAMESSNRPSYLDWMLGGDYNTFLWQRRHLKELHEQHLGAVE